MFFKQLSATFRQNGSGSMNEWLTLFWYELNKGLKNSLTCWSISSISFLIYSIILVWATVRTNFSLYFWSLSKTFFDKSWEISSTLVLSSFSLVTLLIMFYFILNKPKITFAWVALVLSWCSYSLQLLTTFHFSWGFLN